MAKVSLGSAGRRMTDPLVLIRLHRIELHVEPNEPESVWRLSAIEFGEGNVAVFGYILHSSEDGFGQAQVVLPVQHVKWSEAAKNKQSRAAFSDWVAKYAAEAMYDTARRALQGQAAMMDAFFDIAIKAPEVKVDFVKAKKDEAAAKSAP